MLTSPSRADVGAQAAMVVSVAGSASGDADRIPVFVVTMNAPAAIV
jgi:hypothetical protein